MLFDLVGLVDVSVIHSKTTGVTVLLNSIWIDFRQNDDNFTCDVTY